MLCFTCINDPYLAVLQGIHYTSKSTAAAERRYIKKNFARKFNIVYRKIIDRDLISRSCPDKAFYAGVRICRSTLHISF